VSVVFAKAVAEGLRRYGVPVSFEPDHEIRGNGQTSNYSGLSVHHTGGGRLNTRTNDLVNGRVSPPLGGPLCNSAGFDNGGIHIIADHPANHAGASGGRSMGPLPTTGLFNKLMWGHEIMYPGSSPMSDAAYRSAQILGKVISDILGRPSPEWVRAHMETSITGKWDPGYAPGKTIDMAAFRRGLWTLATGDITVAQIDDVLVKLDTLIAKMNRSVDMGVRVLEQDMGGDIRPGGKLDEEGRGHDLWDGVPLDPKNPAKGPRRMTHLNISRETEKEVRQELLAVPGTHFPAKDTVAGWARTGAAQAQRGADAAVAAGGAVAVVLERLGALEAQLKDLQVGTPAPTDVAAVVEGVKELLDGTSLAVHKG